MVYVTSLSEALDLVVRDDKSFCVCLANESSMALGLGGGSMGLVVEENVAKGEGDEEEEEEVEQDQSDSQQAEEYDSDESADDVVTKADDGNTNSQLAVGYKHDRSFVVRGSKIGVFKHTPNNNLEFSTNISKVETPGGKLFSPKKVMLHSEDTDMILQDEANPNSLYRMDLEYGKVVDEWKVHDDIAVKTFAPEKVANPSCRRVVISQLIYARNSPK